MLEEKEGKREFRSLWIVRINAAVREDGLNYSSFISSLKKSNVALNRKMIAQIAISDKNCFRELIQSTK